MIHKIIHFFFSFSGRIGRWDFFVVVVSAPLLLSAFMRCIEYIARPGTALTLNAFFSAFLFISFLSFYARRLHDMNYSSWWLLGLFAAGAVITVVLERMPVAWLLWPAGILYVLSWIVFLCIPGTQGANQYGNRPPTIFGRQIFKKTRL